MNSAEAFKHVSGEEEANMAFSEIREDIDKTLEALEAKDVTQDAHLNQTLETPEQRNAFRHEIADQLVRSAESIMAHADTKAETGVGVEKKILPEMLLREEAGGAINSLIEKFNSVGIKLDYNVAIKYVAIALDGWAKRKGGSAEDEAKLDRVFEQIGYDRALVKTFVPKPKKENPFEGIHPAELTQAEKKIEEIEK